MKQSDVDRIVDESKALEKMFKHANEKFSRTNISDQVFKNIVENRISSIKNTLAKKEVEYASDGDRLHNFHVASKINNQTPAQALWAMATKHLVSIIDFINGKLDISNTEMVNEKIGDMINYLILLEACFEEERAIKKNEKQREQINIH